jgi:hypothetical protein
LTALGLGGILGSEDQSLQVVAQADSIRVVFNVQQLKNEVECGKFGQKWEGIHVIQAFFKNRSVNKGLKAWSECWI